MPASFPEEFKFVAKGGKVHKVNYPGLMLNVMCADNNTNGQYHELVKKDDGTTTYDISSRMSIEFEVDGPYLVCPPTYAFRLAPSKAQACRSCLSDSCAPAR